MLRRVATVVGALCGWGSAVATATLGLMGRVPHETAQPLMLLMLGVGAVSSACLALRSHQRPLGAAFELGYEMARRDAIREATKRSNVTPIRGARERLSESVTGEFTGWAALGRPPVSL